MKFSCEKVLLQSAVATASRAVSPKSSIPALEGVLLQAGRCLTVSGYNMNTGISTNSLGRLSGRCRTMWWSSPPTRI